MLLQLFSGPEIPVAVYVMKGNIELPSRVPWQRGFWNSRLNEVQKIHQEKQFVKSDFFTSSKSPAFDFFGLGLLIDLPHLFLTVSWRLLVFNVLGNVTNSLLLCGAMRDVNEICKSRSTTLFIPTPKIYCLTIKPSKIIWTSDVYNQDTHWEAESNHLRTIRES